MRAFLTLYTIRTRSSRTFCASLRSSALIYVTVVAAVLTRSNSHLPYTFLCFSAPLCAPLRSLAPSCAFMPFLRICAYLHAFAHLCAPLRMYVRLALLCTRLHFPCAPLSFSARLYTHLRSPALMLRVEPNHIFYKHSIARLDTICIRYSVVTV